MSRSVEDWTNDVGAQQFTARTEREVDPVKMEAMRLALLHPVHKQIIIGSVNGKSPEPAGDGMYSIDKRKGDYLEVHDGGVDVEQTIALAQQIEHYLRTGPVW